MHVLPAGCIYLRPMMPETPHHFLQLSHFSIGQFRTDHLGAVFSSGRNHASTLPAFRINASIIHELPFLSFLICHRPDPIISAVANCPCPKQFCHFLRSPLSGNSRHLNLCTKILILNSNCHAALPLCLFILCPDLCICLPKKRSDGFDHVDGHSISGLFIKLAVRSILFYAVNLPVIKPLQPQTLPRHQPPDSAPIGNSMPVCGSNGEHRLFRLLHPPAILPGFFPTRSQHCPGAFFF